MIIFQWLQIPICYPVASIKIVDGNDGYDAENLPMKCFKGLYG